MNILVNGKPREVLAADLSVANLSTVLSELGYRNAVIATALNGDFVPNIARAITPVTDGDRLEVVAPMQGG